MGLGGDMFLTVILCNKLINSRYFFNQELKKNVGCISSKCDHAPFSLKLNQSFLTLKKTTENIDRFNYCKYINKLQRKRKLGLL